MKRNGQVPWPLLQAAAEAHPNWEVAFKTAEGRNRGAKTRPRSRPKDTRISREMVFDQTTQRTLLGSEKRSFLAMTIKVELDGDEIVVTKPGTDFMLAYRKLPDRSDLVLWRSWVSINVSSPELSGFRAQAFQAAVSKARELGWIV